MSKAKLFLGASVILVLLISIAIPISRKYSQAKLADSLINRPFERVKGGQTYVSIMNLSLLRKLASDNSCVANLNEITFCSVTLDSSELQYLAKLKNVQTIGFYCCGNTDAAVPLLVDRDLKLLWFELGDLTPESLQVLGAEGRMQEIAVEKNLTRDEVAILKGFPSEISITTSFPLNAYE